jgi:hypothetical protein
MKLQKPLQSNKKYNHTYIFLYESALCNLLIATIFTSFVGSVRARSAQTAQFLIQQTGVTKSKAQYSI